MTSASVEDIVGFLTADATQVDPQTKLQYTVSRTGDNLNEKILDGAEWGLPNLIGPANLNAPVTYVQGATQRSIITIDKNGALSSYNADSEDDWAKGALDSAGIKPHAQTKLAATFHGGKWHVFYQNSDGKLAEATSADGATWQSGTLPNADPRPGTVISSIGLNLVYQHRDGHLHSLENHNGTWEDKGLDKAEVEGDVSNILVTEAPKDGNIGVVYLNNAGKVLISTKEQKSELGQVDANGAFKAKSSAECGNVIIIGRNYGCIRF